MNIIVIIFLMTVRVATSNPDGLQLEYHPECTITQDIDLNLSTGLMCVPKGTEFRDFIYKNSFER